MRKLMLLLAMLAMVVVVTSVAAPAMAQDPKAEKQAQKAEKQAQKVQKQAQKAGAKDQMKEMPKTGGVPVNTALLGLGASAMLVGGGLLVRRVTR